MVAMRRSSITGSYAYDVCEKPTTRMYGFLAVVHIQGENGATLTRFRTSVRGFGAAHREDIPDLLATWPLRAKSK
jgi:hypothetical protein